MQSNGKQLGRESNELLQQLASFHKRVFSTAKKNKQPQSSSRKINVLTSYNMAQQPQFVSEQKQQKNIVIFAQSESKSRSALWTGRDSGADTGVKLLELKAASFRQKYSQAQKLLAGKEKRIEELVDQLRQNQELVSETLSKWRAAEQKNKQSLQTALREKQQLQLENQRLKRTVQEKQQQLRIKDQTHAQTLRELKADKQSRLQEWKEVVKDLTKQVRVLKSEVGPLMASSYNYI